MSHTTLTALHGEHSAILALLDILEHQRRGLDRGDSPDFAVMADILDYVDDDVDSSHHALEAGLFERLDQGGRARDALVAELGDRRANLSRQGRRLRRLVGTVLDGAIVPRPQLARLTQRYVDGYRSLVAREENEAFPILARHLDPSDWLESVTECLWRQRIPVPPTVDEQYAALQQRIRKEAGGYWPGGPKDGDCCPVCASD